MTMRAIMGPVVHDEHVTSLADAKSAIDDALRADDPAVARRAIAVAIGALHRADTRLAAHAAPSS